MEQVVIGLCEHCLRDAQQNGTIETTDVIVIVQEDNCEGDCINRRSPFPCDAQCDGYDEE